MSQRDYSKNDQQQEQHHQQQQHKIEKKERNVNKKKNLQSLFDCLHHHRTLFYIIRE
jgi:hypothetical protein